MNSAAFGGVDADIGGSLQPRVGAADVGATTAEVGATNGVTMPTEETVAINIEPSAWSP